MKFSVEWNFSPKNDAVVQHKSGAVARMGLSEKLAEQMLLRCSGEKKDRNDQQRGGANKKSGAHPALSIWICRLSY